MFMTACQGLSPTPMQTATLIPPSGLETTPTFPHPYPDALTVETATATMAAVTDAPVIIPVWQKALETQDPQDKYFKVVDGVPAIDRYDTSEMESIVLSPESIKNIQTNDSLNPNILTAKDVDGNTYAFNPDHGWFALPRVEMDYNKLESYTQVEQAFVEDGRANITTALLYAENPTISPDAIDPVYWVSNFWMDKTSNDKIPMLCNNMCGLGEARMSYNEEASRSFYTADTKPFAWTGFYKVQLTNGEYVYVVVRTLKNPSATNPDQIINLFYGFDKQYFQNIYNNVLGDNVTTELKMLIDGTDKGGCDLAFILPPPTNLDGKDIPFRLSPYDWITGGNPVVSGLQKRGELIAMFDPVNLKIMMGVLHGDRQKMDYVAPLTQPLPAGFSTHILLAGFMNR